MLTVRHLLRLTRLDREEGQVLPMFAAGVLAMLLMTGIVVDGGNLFQNRQSLQNAADAAAIAAALEVANGNCTTGTTGPCAMYAGKYANLNNANDSGNALPTCASLNQGVSNTKPPSTSPGCYVYPYTPPGASSDDYVEVWLTRKTSNFFGGLLGLFQSTESARAVGSLTSGNPPPIAFAALNSSCDSHTLLIESSGNLTVHSGIYVNSCSGHDGFDVFSANTGSPGSIKATGIYTTGGWEVDKGTGVYVGPFPNPPLCPKTPLTPVGGGKWSYNPYSPTPNGCPATGQTQSQCSGVGVAVCDPFASFPPAPALGTRNVMNITGIKRVGAVATVFVAGPIGHGLRVGSSGESVTISGVGAPFDGAHTVSSVPDATTFTYAVANGPTIPLITGKQMAGGLATLTTSVPVTFFPGNAVTVSGIDNIFDASNAAVTTNSSTFSYQPPPFQMTVSNQQLQAGTAMLNVNSTTGVAVGDTVNVTASGANPLNALLRGSHVLSGVAAGTISYAVPGISVSSKAIANSTTATLTTAANSFAVGDQIAVAGVDARFNGTFTTTAVSPTSVTYTIPSVKATISKTGAAGGLVTLTTSTDPTAVFENGDTVMVATGQLAYDGSFAIGNVTSATKTFTYSPGTFAGTYTARVGTTVTITTASAHGLHVNNKVNVTGFTGAQSCLNLNNATVTAQTATTFKYTVAATCTPATGPSGTVLLVTAATANAPAGKLATLKTMPTISSGGTVWKNIAWGAATGTATVTDVPQTAATGTFDPFWMQTLGFVNLPGSALSPSPYEISSGSPILQPGTYYGGICLGAASGSNCTGTNCKAAGGTTSTIQPYSPVVKLAADVPDNFDATGGTGTIQVTQAGISNGDVIAIDDEEMTVTGPPVDNGDGTFTIPVSREANGTVDGPHTSGTEIFDVVTTTNAVAYNPAVKLNGNLDAKTTSVSVPIQWGGQPTTDPIQVNDVIQIGSEDMLVTAETGAANSKATLTVTRGYYSTTPATHNNGAAVLQASSGSAPDVTLSQGVYIMAGGGFSVCGSASVSAPDGVMIYNTNDPTVPTGNGALGQVDINTTGNVHLGPMASGIYAGMTIFEDRQKAFSTACPQADPTKWDIALQSAAPLPSSGELGSISGTIYAPSMHATVGDTMSGTANLAVISSCIFINGADSTFNHDTNISPLAGVSATLDG